eukprot:TRINITY_DN33916_c0_g1_i1.p1 TRINITY_DN33916_c0_g1~~TRINITY_DN33916_c0_g1_i1.p1  ORF type:complete len:134 (-),score=13.90 TRINITY_DN33916_c0_g1_i1:81-482(-)
MDDETWPKVVWLRDQTDKAVSSYPEDGTAEGLRDALSALLCTENCAPRETHPEPSPETVVGCTAEEQHRRHLGTLLFGPSDGFMTRQQSIMLCEQVDGGKKVVVHYFYRDISGEEHLATKWEKFVVEKEAAQA